MSFKIHISESIRTACPDFALAVIETQIQNTPFETCLWENIEQAVTLFRQKYKIEEIKNIPAISATRLAYKKLEKDPNRYRPSAESLCRRILRDIPIYKINTMVDTINLVSIRSGYSIGGSELLPVTMNGQKSVWIRPGFLF